MSHLPRMDLAEMRTLVATTHLSVEEFQDEGEEKELS